MCIRDRYHTSTPDDLGTDAVLPVFRMAETSVAQAVELGDGCGAG